MEIKTTIREGVIVLLSAFILAMTVSFRNNDFLLYATISFLVIIGANLIIKKIVGYYLEIKIIPKFWSVYNYGFRKDSHFKVPVPMFWLPLIGTLITGGYFWWLAILEFDVMPRVERVSKRHGLYRYTEVTEYHIGSIAIWGIAANIALAIIAYFANFEEFSKLSIYFIAWSIIPLSSLDGSKILFMGRKIWAIMAILIAMLTLWALLIV
jgi:hypothetical protein